MITGRPWRAVPGTPTLFTIPVLRYMVSPSARESGGPGASDEAPELWVALSRERRNKSTNNWRWSRWCVNGRRRTRAIFRASITFEDVLSSRMIACPFRLLQCCLMTDGGGALILVVRAKQIVPVFPFLVAPRKRGSRAAALSGPPPVQARGKLWVPAFAGKTEKECGYQMFNSHH
jgi:hypothetical protein